MKAPAVVSVLALTLFLTGCDSPKELKQRFTSTVSELFGIKRPERLDNWIYLSDDGIVSVMNLKADGKTEIEFGFFLNKVDDFTMVALQLRSAEKASCGKGNVAFVKLSNGRRSLELKAINNDGSCTMYLEQESEILKLMAESNFIHIETKVGPYDFNYILANTDTAVSRFRELAGKK
ncbi:hypothetical protein [Pseudomonas sp. PDM31]|uniref:hypothetical protein n=1 Tax=Pseudomonas sp. PDM31 TaxID=2854778 RepID=UPI001C4573BD|nr:hypothetical protein [Pseudomonas sp. PDM31]MBV7480350.1 hypothetical protein [Pseudomonas sp. PDM31]